MRGATAAAAVALLLGACSSGDEESAIDTTTTAVAAEPDDDGTNDDTNDDSSDPSSFFPDVVDATATQADDGTWTFSVTLSSPYDTPEQYADGWRVVGPDGTELGFRLLTHDHANEQPFTRSQSGITISEEVTTVTIEGRDLANGWGGESLELELPN